eukprot:s672_g3.t1
MVSPPIPTTTFYYTVLHFTTFKFCYILYCTSVLFFSSLPLRLGHLRLRRQFGALLMLFFLGNVGAHESSAEAPNVTVVTATTMLLLAGAGFLKQSNTCRRRKAPEDAPEKWPNTANFQRVVSESDVVDDAEKCWTIGYGSCKYTGLRPDALDPSKGPPEPLSIEEADWLQVPELREGEADKLEELRQKVVDIREQHRHRVDNCTLLRFLRAEKGKVPRAEKKLREAIKWMEENDVANVFKTWNLEA